MLRPFKTETLQEIIDMVVLTTIIDNGLTCGVAENSPNTIEHLASMMMAMVRHNRAVEIASIEEKLMIPVTEEMRTMTKDGRTFGIITGGKG